MATNDRMEQERNKGSNQDPNRTHSGMGSSTSQQSGKPTGSQGSQHGSQGSYGSQSSSSGSRSSGSSSEKR